MLAWLRTVASYGLSLLALALVDGLRADHQSSQPGTSQGTGKSLSGWGDAPHMGAHNFAMMNGGPIWKQNQRFGNNGASINRLIVWRGNQADANVSVRSVKRGLRSIA